MSKTDPTGALARMLGGHGAKQADGINVALPCKVVTFDPATLTASVQPLLKLSASDPAQIMSVPVAGQKFKFKLDIDTGKGKVLQEFETVMRPVLSPGDTVYVVCADAEIKNTLSGRVAAPDSGRRHSRMDAVIVGVMPCSL
ncbi:Gp138 family membrane-puncturing spike protein [Paenibacillus sp. FSL P2-0089]|uniref:Gp138 family membrane-puncturing spike protein n=1 Tax=Paenibacillus sp. FSL P2-0089 TaxID=2954526 RepID=UPI00315995EE